MSSEVLEPFSAKGESIDWSLDELRVGRRLQKVTHSVENFLLNQMERLQAALDGSAQVEQQNELLQRMFAEFEKNKRDWEKRRIQEEQRLYEAGEQLMHGWEQLEVEKRKLGLG